MSIVCWFKHMWRYDNPDPVMAWTRKCLRCGKRQRITLNGEWVVDDRPEKQAGGGK